MNTSAKKCPHCSHDNMPAAVYCFECHQCLNVKQPINGIIPHYQSLSSPDEPEYPDFSPDDLDLVKERQKTRDYVLHLDNGLVCIRCSTVNRYNTEKCRQCNAYLNVPDEITQLSSVGSALSSIGQVRTINEDEVGLWGRGNTLIALVADGMGGAAAGEEASRYVREAVHSHFVGVINGSESLDELSEDEIVTRLRTAVNEGNSAIIRRINADSSVRGMGTTATIALVRGNRAIFAHIGDSRAYLISKKHKSIIRVTDDHSFVEVLIAAGHITRRQAAIHPMRSVLYRALGHNQTEVLDVYKIDVEDGDRLLLCSDGLTRHVTEEELLRHALDFEDPAKIGEQVIDLANMRGGEDNISVATVILKEDDRLLPEENLLPTPCKILRHQMQSADNRSTEPIIEPND